MALFTRLEEELKRALIARDATASETLKLVKSAVLLQAKAAGGGTPSDEIVQAAVYKQIRNCREAAELYAGQDQQEEASQKRREAELLEKLLPKQLNRDELAELVEEVLRETRLDPHLANFKALLECASAKAGLSASRAELAKVLKERLAT